MKTRLQQLIRPVLAIALFALTSLTVISPALADNTAVSPTAPYQLNAASNVQCPPSGCIGKPKELGVPQVDTANAVVDAIDILSLIAGILSVIFIVLGGIRFTTSSGDATRASGARQTILFAVIGLAVSLIAPLIVGFVITRGPS